MTSNELHKFMDKHIPRWKIYITSVDVARNILQMVCDHYAGGCPLCLPS